MSVYKRFTQSIMKADFENALIVKINRSNC
jgi:hypothetical protein